MAVNPPILDDRSVEALLNHFRALVPAYTPGWRGYNRGDPGAVLMALFAWLYRRVVVRRNELPGVLLTEFLRTLDIDRLPTAPALASFIFKVNPDCPEPYVYVPRGTRLNVGLDEEGNPIPFETMSPLAASPARVAAVISADLETDVVCDHTEKLLGGTRTACFSTADNVQTHEVYLGDAALFNVNGPCRVNLAFGLAVTFKPVGFVVEARLGKQAFTSLEGAPGSDVRRGGAVKRLILEAEEGKLFLRLDYDGDLSGVKEAEIGGVESRWVKITFQCQTGFVAREAAQAIFAGVTVSVFPFGEEQAGFIRAVPDLAFENDVPVETSAFEAEGGDSCLRPFGLVPAKNDTFYLACDEVFATAGAYVKLSFYGGRGRPGDADEGAGDKPSAVVIWEYFNGTGWLALPLAREPGDDPALTKGEAVIHFCVPEDTKPVKVNGHERYWIRARLTDGDYGKVVYVTREGRVEADDSGVKEPAYSRASLSYRPAPRSPQHVYIKDNLALRNLKPGDRLFNPPPTPSQAVYLGFDKRLAGAPVSLFLHFEDYPYEENFTPDFRWFVSGGRGEWIPVSVADGTRELTRSGYVAFNPPADFTAAELFGRRLFWLRGENGGARFSAAPEERSGFLKGDVREFSPENSRAEAGLKLRYRDGDLPVLAGVYLNAVACRATFSVERELLGSSDGTPEQIFQPAHAPVIDSAVYVEEGKHLSFEEIERLRVEGFEVDTRSGVAGEPAGAWVRWREVATLRGAGPEDRVYTVDPTTGGIAFGDGLRGKAPPAGRDNVVVYYRTGGGRATNVAAEAEVELAGGVSYIDEVFNALAAAGGEDAEPLDAVYIRGPRLVRYRGRAVTAVDFEDLVRQRFRGLAKIRCFPGIDAVGKPALGSVTVLIVPDATDPRPELPVQLREEAEDYLRRRCAALPAFGNRVTVAGPVYAACDVSADVRPRDIRTATELKSDVEDALNAFLHPLTGGREGAGWDFGRVPTLSNIYAVIEGVPGVEAVEAASFTIRAARDGRVLGYVNSLAEYLSLPPFALISQGDYLIGLKA